MRLIGVLDLMLVGRVVIYALINTLLDLAARDSNIAKLVIAEPFKLSNGLAVNPATELLNLCFGMVRKQSEKKTFLKVCCV